MPCWQTHLAEVVVEGEGSLDGRRPTRGPSADWQEGAGQGEDEQEPEHEVGPRHGYGGEVSLFPIDYTVDYSSLIQSHFHFRERESGGEKEMVRPLL